MMRRLRTSSIDASSRNRSTRPTASSDLSPITLISVRLPPARGASVDVDAHARRRRRHRGRVRDDAQVVELRAHALAAHVHFGVVRRALTGRSPRGPAGQPQPDRRPPGSRLSRRSSRSERRRRRSRTSPSLTLCAISSSALPRLRARRADRRPSTPNSARARLEPVHDAVDLALRVAQPLFDLLVEAPAERFLAVAQLLLARLQPAPASPRPSAARARPDGARDRAPARSRSTWARCSASCASRAVRCARACSMMLAGSPSRVAISSARLLPGRAVMQPVGRRERLGVESETRGRHPFASSTHTSSARRSASSRPPSRRARGSDR